MSLISPQIFISYRRQDTAAEAGRIRSSLRQKLGQDRVFMDTSSIRAGTKWPDEIHRALNASETVIVVIGPEWLRAGSNERGQRRIDQENDWVRQEVSMALKENKRVIPVLVRGATMPAAEALPECINSLPQRQKLDLRNEYWDHDLELLLGTLSPLARTDLQTKIVEAIERNFRILFSILASPKQFFLSKDRTLETDFRRAVLFAGMISLLALAIHLPLFRVLKIHTGSASYIIVDTILTFAFWFLYAGCLHVCAKLVLGGGAYLDSLTGYLYLRAFVPLQLLVSFPAEMAGRKRLGTGEITGLFEFLESFLRMLAESPDVLFSLILMQIVFIWYFVCLVQVYKTIHRLRLFKAIVVGVFGHGLEVCLKVFLEIPVMRIVWRAFLAS